jgi:hypothetical protein
MLLTALLGGGLSFGFGACSLDQTESTLAASAAQQEVRSLSPILQERDGSKKSAKFEAEKPSMESLGCDAGSAEPALAISWAELNSADGEKVFAPSDRLVVRVRNQSGKDVIADFKLIGSAAHVRLEKKLDSRRMAAGEVAEIAVSWDELDIDTERMRAAGDLLVASSVRGETTGQTWRVTSPGLWFHPGEPMAGTSGQAKRPFVAYGAGLKAKKYRLGNFRGAIRPVPEKPGEECDGVNESAISAHEIEILHRDDPDRL